MSNIGPVERFAADLGALMPTAGARFGIACSGGPDSTALLLLAARALPGQVEAATVDHRLRVESGAEAELAGANAARRGVPHMTLTQQPLVPGGNLQARARALRYALLGAWAQERGLAAVLTGHHLDDQAETILMRLARGAGLTGLSGIRPVKVDVDGGPPILRPLLGWRRDELAALVAKAGLATADDPSNRDLRHDRTHVRALLAGSVDLLPPTRLAAAAAHLGEADSALDQLADLAFAATWDERGRLRLADVSERPRAIRRRVLVRALNAVRERHALATPAPGADVEAMLRALDAGDVATLGRIKAEVVDCIWRFSPVPPHRSN